MAILGPRWLAAAIVVSLIGVVSSAGPVVRAHGDVLAQSKNFRFIRNVPLHGVVVGARLVDDTYFVSSWHSGLYSFDVSKPEEPRLLDHMGPDKILVQSNENEDLATNGKILLLSQFNRTGSTNRLLVIDVRNPKNMRLIATLDGAGAHTLECLFGCKWAYGSSSGSSSDGIIVDLRNPSKPKLLSERWSDAIGGQAAHDVTEVRPGLVVTSSSPMLVLDVRDPRKPRVVMRTDPAAPNTGHNNIWPRAGRDRFLISASEGVNNGRCEMYEKDGKTLQVWDTRRWRTRGFKPAGSYTLRNGNGSDGHPPLDVFGIQGCSAHWAHEHPSFRNGGLVAMAAYSHGIQLLDIGGDGKPREVGYFLQDIQAAIDVEWITDRILYVIDDAPDGGFDVIKYTGRL